MSSYWAGYHGIACCLSEAEFSGFLAAYKEKQKEKTKELEELLETEPLRYVAFCPSDGSQTPFYITDIGPDTCDGMTFTPYRNNDGSVNQVPVDLRETTSYILFADKQMDSPLAIDNPTERYVNYGELKEEFQRKLAEYVPADFSWESHIGLFEYAAYA